uniref:Uncharacterized protein n=1 Tax=Oryza sativa subsp. japonica TaxID=39947 RepID=Q6YWM4_ORYSJ|nr:hypothetical protein [Oryza sativa Japonica Group]BAD20167.1 hypothetical protein [Oryza sativa Japonica Group]
MRHNDYLTRRDSGCTVPGCSTARPSDGTAWWCGTAVAMLGQRRGCAWRQAAWWRSGDTLQQRHGCGRERHSGTAAVATMRWWCATWRQRAAVVRQGSAQHSG